WSATPCNTLRRGGTLLISIGCCGLCLTVGTWAQPEPEPDIGDGTGDEREPEVHDPVAEDGQHRRGPRRAEADGDGYQRDLDDAQPAGGQRDGAGDVRRRVGDDQRAG